MKIAIIGSGGMIGRGVTRSLSKLKNSNYLVKKIKKKLGENNYIKNSEYNYDYVICCCGPIDEKQNTLKKSYLKKFLNDLLIIGKNSKIIYFSSAHVFSNLNNLINEDTIPDNNKSEYAKAHLFLEKEIHKMKGHIIRVQAVYNFKDINNLKRNHLLPIALPISLKKNKPFLINNPKDIRNFISSDILGDLIIDYIKNKSDYSIFHATGEITCEIGQLNKIFEKIKQIKKQENFNKLSSINLSYKKLRLNNGFKSKHGVLKSNIFKDSLIFF